MKSRLATLTLSAVTAMVLVVLGGAGSVAASSTTTGSASATGTAESDETARTGSGDSAGIPSTGIDPPLLDTAGTQPLQIVTSGGSMNDFLSSVMADVDAYWSTVWASAERPTPYVNYAFPLPGEAVMSACTETGVSDDTSAYYCASDDMIVVSQQFAILVWNGAIKANPDLTERRPTGDFSVAFVVAHEYAHSLQAELGWVTPVGLAYPGYKIELHADCWAGVWANAAYYEGILESGDIEEAVQTALDLGDYYVTDPGHHGTPAQRSGAFLAGYNGGTQESCETYLTNEY
jgi:predicted metalloprotease